MVGVSEPARFVVGHRVDDFAREGVAKVPMKRFGQPEEVANTVLFLATPETSYITGVDVNVDGGMGQV